MYVVGEHGSVLVSGLRVDQENLLVEAQRLVPEYLLKRLSSAPLSSSSQALTASVMPRECVNETHFKSKNQRRRGYSVLIDAALEDFDGPGRPLLRQRKLET